MRTYTDGKITIPVLEGAIEGKTIKIKCPFCGEIHTHGFTDVEMSHRVAHCEYRHNPKESISIDGMECYKKYGYYVRPKKIMEKMKIMISESGIAFPIVEADAKGIVLCPFCNGRHQHDEIKGEGRFDPLCGPIDAHQEVHTIVNGVKVKFSHGMGYYVEFKK